MAKDKLSNKVNYLYKSFLFTHVLMGCVPATFMFLCFLIAYVIIEKSVAGAIVTCFIGVILGSISALFLWYYPLRIRINEDGVHFSQTLFRSGYTWDLQDVEIRGGYSSGGDIQQGSYMIWIKKIGSDQEYGFDVPSKDEMNKILNEIKLQIPETQ